MAWFLEPEIHKPVIDKVDPAAINTQPDFIGDEFGSVDNHRIDVVVVE